MLKFLLCTKNNKRYFIILYKPRHIYKVYASEKFLLVVIFLNGVLTFRIIKFMHKTNKSALFACDEPLIPFTES